MSQAVRETFPSIVPSQREFSQGQYPTKTYRALSGATVKRSFGNRPSGSKLKLVYQNVSDRVVRQLLRHYENTAGGFLRFNIPGEVWSGIDETVKNIIDPPGSTKPDEALQWEYIGPPMVQSVYRDVSNVTIELQGEPKV